MDRSVLIDIFLLLYLKKHNLYFSGSNEQSNLVKMRNSNLGQSAPSLTANVVRNDLSLIICIQYNVVIRSNSPIE